MITSYLSNIRGLQNNHWIDASSNIALGDPITTSNTSLYIDQDLIGGEATVLNKDSAYKALKEAREALITKELENAKQLREIELREEKHNKRFKVINGEFVEQAILTMDDYIKIYSS